jgi:outer membrane autotransporter protein
MALKKSIRSRALSTTAFALGVTISLPAAAANTTAADVNVLNLLSPFLSLDSTQVGETTLSVNLSQALATNLYASENPVIEATSISDKTIFSGNSTSITLANNMTESFGPGANLGGGLPVQAVQSVNGIAPYQQYGGLGTLGGAYQAAVSPSGATAPALVTLLNSAYSFTSTDLGIAKYYFANGTINGSTAAVAPTGSTLPTADGYPNTSTSVYDTAYGVSNTGTNQNTYGDSRPVQVDPSGVVGYDPTALTGLATNPSFPSGHTTYGFTDSILIGMLAPQFYQSMLLRGSEYGNSRISLGVHYPLDIIASRSFVQYDLAQLLNGDAGYTTTNTVGSTTALSLSADFTAAQPELTSALGGTSVIDADAANNPYNAYSLANYSGQGATNSAIYDYRMNYGLPTLSYAAAPREQAPSDGPDASILLATIYGGSTAAAETLAPNGGIYGDLASATINQIIVNTETQALAAFYGTDLSYWSRLDLYDAIGYFGGVTGTLTLAPTDQVTTNVAIANTGILRGTGAIGTNAASNSLEVQSGGVVYPGSSGETAGGTMTVNGNVTLDAGSALQATGFFASGGAVSTDNLRVTGNLGISGAAKVVLTGVYLPGKVYNLINVGGTITGGFGASASTDQTDLMALISAPLQYGADPYVYTIPQADFAAAATSANGRAVATAIDTAVNGGNYSASTATALDQLIAGTTPANAAALFSGLSGEIIADQQQAAIDAGTQFATIVLNQINRVAGNPAGQYHSWISGFGAHEEQNGSNSDGTAKQLTGVTGFAAGADSHVTPDTLVGLAAGYSSATFSAAQRGSGSLDGADIGLYAQQDFGSFYLAGTAAYAHYNDTTNRAGLAGTDKGRFGSNQVIARAEGGDRLATGAGDLTPFVGLQVISLSNARFNEAGGTLALSARSKTVGSEQSSLGVQFDTCLPLGSGGAVSPFIRLSWDHEFNTKRNVSVSLQALPAGFTVTGARAVGDAADISGGLNASITANVTLYGTFGGEIADRGDSYSGNGGIKISW